MIFLGTARGQAPGRCVRKGEQQVGGLNLLSEQPRGRDKENQQEQAENGISKVTWRNQTRKCREADCLLLL
eukprot:332844-Hanusia_phi.AAC.1